jgi:hypothetical protein
VGRRRLDGAHLAGLVATLPLGGPDPLAGPAPLPAAPLPAAPELADAGAGLVLGRNRSGEPVAARLFRPEGTVVVLAGGLALAQLVTSRALATGAHLYLRTSRPHAWDAFLRAVRGPGTTITVADTDPPPAALLRPQLVVLDGGPAPPDAPWRTVLLIRDALTAADVDHLARADLALLAPLTEAQALLAGAALGLGATGDWLARIRGDMLGAVIPRQTVRWAVATPTALERRILGRPTGPPPSPPSPPP